MSDRQQAEHAAATWIAKRDAGMWTAGDAAAFEAWLSESAGNRAAYYRFNGAWLEAGRLNALTGAGATATNSSAAAAHAISATTGVAALSGAKAAGCPTSSAAITGAVTSGAASIGAPSSGQSRRDRATRRSFISRKSLVAVAATAVLTICVTNLVFESRLLPRNGYSTVVGGLQNVPMSDGSTVTLNTNSAIRVAVTDKERRVDLEQGEAFFNVAKDPNRPFVVTVDGQRIVAVGTAFAVRREGNDTRVIVEQGRVRVEVPGKDAKLMEPVSAGSVVRTSSNEVLVQTKRMTEIEQSLSWRSGLLTFRDTPLADAVAEFNRYNTRKIVIEDPEVAALQVGGIFRATHLDPFVHLLQDGFPVRATAEGERIVLRAK